MQQIQIDYVVTKLEIDITAIVNIISSNRFVQQTGLQQPTNLIVMSQFCGHIFSRFSPFSLLSVFHSMFSLSQFHPFSIPLSTVFTFSLSHSHSYLFVCLLFFIGHCLYSSLFSLLKIAFIRTAIKVNGMFNVRQMFHLLMVVCSFSSFHHFCYLFFVHLKMPEFMCTYKFGYLFFFFECVYQAGSN